MNAWEYLIVALPPFEAAQAMQGQSSAVDVLNREGASGWEAFGASALPDGTLAVLMKRTIASSTRPDEAQDGALLQDRNRHDDEDTMSPAEWLADSEVADPSERRRR